MTLASPPSGPINAAIRICASIENAAAVIPCAPIMVVRSAAGKSSVAAEFAPTVITSDAILNQQ